MENYSRSVFALLCIVAIAKSEILHSSGEICDDVNINGNLGDVKKSLQKLEKCQIVEGAVKILNLQGSPAFGSKFFANVSFPSLTEITDYLLINDVSGLESVTQLFPNLTRIGGRNLFTNYSLVIYGNSDLEDIGLSNLKNISRGAVRIENNEMLCYVDTIDWDQIVEKEFQDRNVMKQNMFTEVCPKCPNGIKNCWSKSAPQNTCKCKGGSCTIHGECCNSACLSCRDDNVNSCTVCKNFILGNAPHESCTDTCTSKTFQFKGYRCISAETCRNLNVKFNYEPRFIAYNGTCMQGCPKGYQIENAIASSEMSATCVKCTDKKCWKPCPGGDISSVEELRKLKGCQLIEGRLVLQINRNKKYNIVSELEDALADIIEITDYLRIVRMPSIMSLNFFKSLKTIQGDRLEGKKNAIVIWDNANLQTLFVGQQQDVNITKGSVSFHENPKLCFYHIENLAGDVKRIDGYDQASTTHGDSNSCNITTIDVNTNEVLSTIASFNFSTVQLVNQTLLGYVVFYTETEKQNLDMWQGRDALNDENWNAKDFSGETVTSNQGIVSITNLKPASQYGYYIVAYLASSEKVGAQSKIKYFTTLPGQPDRVQNLESTAENSSSIRLAWKAPTAFNGEPQSYEISYRKLDIMKDIIKDRDFCSEKINVADLQREIKSSTRNASRAADANNKNSASGVDPFLDELTRLQGGDVRTKRSVPASDQPHEDGHKVVNTSITSVTLKGFEHFTTYMISVRACRKPNQDKDGKSNEEICSFDSQTVIRTNEDPAADLIEHLDVHVVHSNNTETDIQLTWKPPTNPNGRVLNYIANVTRIDGKKEPDIVCISVKDRENVTTQTITHLTPGNYSVKFAVFSMAGPGNFTEVQYVFIDHPEHSSLFSSPTFLMLMLLILGAGIGMAVYTVQKRRHPHQETMRRLDNFEADLINE